MSATSYRARLNNLATRAADAASVVSDGDQRLMNQAHLFECRPYKYINGGYNAKGQGVWFCWTTRKDNSGSFYSWREVHGQKRMWRYQLSTRRTKAAAKSLAYRRQNAWAEKKP